MIGINQFVPYFLGFVAAYAFGNLLFAFSCLALVLVNIHRINLDFKEYYLLILLCIAGSVLQLIMFGSSEGLLKDLVLIWCLFFSLAFFSSISYERKHFDTSKILDFTLVIFFLYYSLGSYVLGFTSLELTKFLFPQSSYHYIATASFFLIAFSYAFERKISYRSLIIFASLCVLLEGRTGIVISIGLIFLKFLFYKTNNTGEFLLRLVIVFVLYFFISNLLLGLLFTIGDFSYKGVSSVARDLMSACYFNLLTFQDYIYGFKPENYYFCYEVFFNRPATENSFLQGISNLGIFSYPLFIFTAYKIFIVLRRDLFAGGMLILFLFRFTTGDFLFFTPYDPLFFSLIFLLDRNTESNKTKQSQKVS